QSVDQIPDQLARLQGVQKRREGIELECGRADAEQMVCDPCQLAADHADELAARRHFSAEQFLNSHAVADVAQNRRAVVEAISVRNGLVVKSALAFLLEAAMQIPDLYVGIDDGFAVEVEEDAHGAVGRGM